MISDRKSLRRDIGDFRNTTLYAERNTCPGFLDKGQAVLESDRVPSSAQPNLFEELTVPEMAAVSHSTSAALQNSPGVPASCLVGLACQLCVVYIEQTLVTVVA